MITIEKGEKVKFTRKCLKSVVEEKFVFFFPLEARIPYTLFDVKYA